MVISVAWLRGSLHVSSFIPFPCFDAFAFGFLQSATDGSQDW